VLGLVISFILWRRRGLASGLRAAAWSLLPLVAGLTGTLRLLWNIGSSITSWAANLVFNPLVWTGIALAGVSAALFAVSGAMRRRGRGTRSKKGQKAVTAEPGSRPATTAGTPTKGLTKGSAADGQDDDMDDIEAILKKHGIS
jgi:hypothetical protein